MKESIDDLGKIINDNESDEENEKTSNLNINNIKKNNSKRTSKANINGRKSLKKSNLQEIDDFLIVLDNSE